MIEINVKAEGKHIREEDGMVYQVVNEQVKEYKLFGITFKRIVVKDVNEYNSLKGDNYNEQNFTNISGVEKPSIKKDGRTSIGFKSTL